jgi:hypothetical protein
MLELFMISRLVRFISRILQAKGRDPGWFQLLTVALWIGGELAGGVIGYLLGLEAGAYGLALLGAAGGATAAYVIARKAAPGAPEPATVVSVFE